MEQKGSAVSISRQALQRMPYYLQYLKKLHGEGVEVVAAPAVAASLHWNEVQVRKDFAAVSPTKGKPKAGFSVRELIDNMEEYLGYRNTRDAVLIGAGSLGTAFLSYQGFAQYGMNIIMAFDADEAKTGKEIGGKPVLPMKELIPMCARTKVRIGIITVPERQAQAVCDQLVEAGILAIWNFAPVHLTTPAGILVQSENIAASLAVLSKHLQEHLDTV